MVYKKRVVKPKGSRNRSVRNPSVHKVKVKPTLSSIPQPRQIIQDVKKPFVSNSLLRFRTGSPLGSPYLVPGSKEKIVEQNRQRVAAGGRPKIKECAMIRVPGVDTRKAMAYMASSRSQPGSNRNPTKGVLYYDDEEDGSEAG